MATSTYVTMIDWDRVTYETTEKFVPPISYGKVVKVYDGDTITVATPLDNTRAPIYHFSVRLRGIDSPEIRGKTPEEKAAATKAREALSEKIMNRMVFLQNIDMEKYGRVLADVFLEEPGSSEAAEKQSISEWMLKNHYGVAYTGGKKAGFSSSQIQDEEDTYYKISTW